MIRFSIILACCISCFGSACLATQPTIYFDQAGYQPSATKYIYTTERADSFFIVSNNTGAVHFAGPLTLWKTADPATGLTLYRGDFSAVTETGNFLARTSNGISTSPFLISTTVYDHLYRAALRGLYFQRCGSPLRATEAGEYQRAACHLNDGFLHVSTGASGYIRATGGWHDAGDFGKYVVNAGVTVGTLLMGYELFPQKFDQDDNGIPESHNGIPDILDEVRYELDWLLKMQRSDGAVYAKLTRTQFEGWIMPASDTDVRYVYQVSSAATADFAAMTAEAARIYRPFAPAFADTCLARAQRAWSWLQDNPFIVPSGGFRNPSGTGTGEYGDGDDSDERLWASAELFSTTGDAAYQTYFKQFSSTTSVMAWPDVRSLADVAYLKNAHASTDSTFRTKVRFRLLTLADGLVAKRDRGGFPVVLQPYDYVWGSNSSALNAAVLLIVAATESGTKAYTDAAAEQLHYVLGANGLGRSFVTGIGSNDVRHPHHRPSEADGVALPVPGLLAGGPNQYRQDPVLTALFSSQTPPALCYADTTPSYASNEIAINWNAPLIFVAGYFAGVNRPDAVRGSKERPEGFRLEQNYPNPFNGSTRIRFTLPTEAKMHFVVADVLGRVVTATDLGTCSPGEHNITWPMAEGGSANVSSGVYYYSLQGYDVPIHAAQKMILMK